MPDGRQASSPLLERAAELERLRALIEAAREGRGRALAVEGAPGIGKTRLLDAAAERAAAAGMRVLRAAGGELEHDLPYGVARQLLDRAAAGAEPLTGASALARPALGLAAAPAGVDPEARHAALHGLYWLTADLAAATPLLLVADDLQWADEPSLRYLAYLTHRLADLPAALLVAARPGLPGERSAALAGLLGRTPDPLAPAPLSEGAIARLAAERLGGEPEAGFAAACREATAGNPLLVAELLGELAEAGAAPTAATGAELERLGTERIGRRVAQRLGGLPAAAVAVAEAVAILGGGARLDDAAGVAGMDAATAARAVDALIAADLLAPGGDGPAFRHPLVGTAVAEGLPPGRRAAAHRRAAERLAERGTRPAEVARHLRATPPTGDGWVVARLEAAAEEAVRQGAPETAAGHLERALAEPPPADRRRPVLIALGRAELAAGAAEGAEQLREALALTADPSAAALTSLELAGALGERLQWREAAKVAHAALARLAGAEPELELLLRATLADAVRMDPAAGDVEVEDLRRRAAGLAGATAAERWVQAVVAAMTPTDSAEEHARVAELLAGTGPPAALPPGAAFAVTGVASNLLRAGRHDAAATVIERGLAEARERGHAGRYVQLLSLRGWVAVERGELRGAHADLEAALELGEELGSPISLTGALLAMVLAEQGRADSALDRLARHGGAGELPADQVSNLTLFFRARTLALAGRRQEALADALEVGRRYAALELRRALPPWRSLAAVLLAHEGARGRAVALAAEEAELAERWGTPQARGAALRAVGLVEGDEGALRAAVDALAASPARLELARARADLGAALRRGGRRSEAREPLRLAMDAAHALGAQPLAQRARSELLATGARPRRPALSGADALTPSERRVVELAATGLTNRRIAQELFVTTATVETHLRHAFAKLDVRSRTELGPALAGSSG